MSKRFFPIGGDIHQMMRPRRQYSAEEKAAFWNYYDALSPAPWRFMEHSWAQEAKARCPESIVVYRPYSPNENDISDPEAYFRFHLPATEGGIILHVGNEPSGYAPENDPDALKRYSDRFARIMDLFGREGRAITGPGWGCGHPDQTKLHHFNSMWDAFSRWAGLHYLAYHPYWTFRGLNPNDGRLMRWTMMLERINNPKVQILFTEWGSDDPLDGTQGKRGYRNYWTGEQYAAISIECIKTYHNHPQIKGVMPYCYGNTGAPTEPPGQGEDWDSFDFSHDDGYKNSIIAFANEWRKVTPVPTPTRPPVPKPGHYTIEASKGLNCRANAGESETILVTLKTSQRVTVLPFTPNGYKPVGNYDWVNVEAYVTQADGSERRFVGWCAIVDGHKWNPIIAPPQEPDFEAVFADVRALVSQQRQAALQSVNAQFDALEANITKLESKYLANSQEENAA